MEEKVHKRRVRYAGRYPKKFEEKYKEHDPEKYADTVAHVIEKGSTPAGMHISGAAGAGLYAGLWRTQSQNAGKAGRRRQARRTRY